MKRLIMIFTLGVFFTLGTVAQGTKVTLSGKIDKYAGADTLYCYYQQSEKHGLDTLAISDKGEFSINYDVKEISDALLFWKGRNAKNDNACCVLLEPEKKTEVVLKLKTVAPDSVVMDVAFKGDNVAKATYANQYYQLFSRSKAFSEDELVKLANYADCKAYIAKCISPMEATLKKVKDADFVKRAQDVLSEQKDNLSFVFANAKEERGVKMAEDPDFMAMIDAINPNDTLQATVICRYLGWYHTANPSKYLPLSTEAAQLKHLCEFTENQDVRNKVADNFLQTIFFYMRFGMNPTEPSLKDFYELYLTTSTETKHSDFINEQLALIEKSAPGKEAIDFAMFDTEGKEHHFKDKVGNGVVTYVDFWATWCGPCCREIPFLEKMADHFKGNEKVRIISISIDTDVDKWKQKIAADKPEWEQYNIPNPEKSEGVSAYSINSIPRFLLFDADGKLYNSSAPRPSQPEAEAMIESLISPEK